MEIISSLLTIQILLIKINSKYTYELLSSKDREQLTAIHSKWYPNDIEKMDTLREGLEKQEIKSIQEISDLILEKDLTKDERS